MADSKKKTKLTVGDIVSSDVTLANLEDIKHRFYEIGKKEGKVSRCCQEDFSFFLYVYRKSQIQ